MIVFTCRSASKTSKVDGEDAVSPKVHLMKLLWGLRLAWHWDDKQKNSDVVIPTCLSQDTKSQVFATLNNGDIDGIHMYLGWRLKCKDSECTFLTPGFFPLLQVSDMTTMRRIRCLNFYEWLYSCYNECLCLLKKRLLGNFNMSIWGSQPT